MDEGQRVCDSPAVVHPDSDSRILVVPALEIGAGTGHVMRCIALVERLGDRAALCLDGRRLPPALRRHSGVQVAELAEYGHTTWRLVVVDGKCTPRETFERYARYGPVVCIDEGGPARALAPYLIDTPLGPPGMSAANMCSLSFLDLPERRAEAVRYPFRRVLVSFGGEDPADLSTKMIDVLLSAASDRFEQITLVEGPVFRRHSWPSGVEVLKNPARLKQRLSAFDCVITSFGLTCFESLAAGVPVILLNPTRYHRRLTRRERIPEIGVGRPRIRRLNALLRDRETFVRLLRRFDVRGQMHESLAGALLSLHPRGHNVCPCCGARWNPAIGRFPEKSFFRCRTCRLIYLVLFGEQRTEYGEGYFFEEYRRQYGRTYLEDFAHIKKLSRERLRHIRRLLRSNAGAGILDVGCAYGAFLDAAREDGYRVYGVDVSAEAVEYLTGTLGIPGACLRFEDYDGPRFDAVTMWYVLEHFSDPAVALRNANRFLKIGGVFAFSTPNVRGVSFLSDRRGFLSGSPPDHWTLWSPDAVRRVLPRYGFTVEQTVVTGHHPERFPRALRASPQMCGIASRVLGLGDTFSVYLKKRRDI